MIDIQTDPIKHLKIKKTQWNEYIEYIDFGFKISYRFRNSSTCQPYLLLCQLAGLNKGYLTKSQMNQNPTTADGHV